MSDADRLLSQAYQLLARQMSGRGHALMRIHNESTGACSERKCTENCSAHRALLAELAERLGLSPEPWTTPRGRTKRDRTA